MSEVPGARCACQDDVARSDLEHRFQGISDPYSELRAGFRAMMTASESNGPLLAAREYAPKILRRALRAGIISEQETKDSLKDGTWNPALSIVNERLRSYDPGVQKVSTYRGYDIYVHKNAVGDVIKVSATVEGSGPRSNAGGACDGVSLTTLVHQNAAVESSASSNPALRLSALLVHWLGEHYSEFRIPVHPALNTNVIFVGHNCVSIVGWSASLLGNMRYMSSDPQDAIAQAADRIREFMEEIKESSSSL